MASFMKTLRGGVSKSVSAVSKKGCQWLKENKLENGVLWTGALTLVGHGFYRLADKAGDRLFNRWVDHGEAWVFGKKEAEPAESNMDKAVGAVVVLSSAISTIAGSFKIWVEHNVSKGKKDDVKGGK